LENQNVIKNRYFFPFYNTAPGYPQWFKDFRSGTNKKFRYTYTKYNSRSIFQKKINVNELKNNYLLIIRMDQFDIQKYVLIKT